MKINLFIFFCVMMFLWGAIVAIGLYTFLTADTDQSAVTPQNNISDISNIIRPQPLERIQAGDDSSIFEFKTTQRGQPTGVSPLVRVHLNPPKLVGDTTIPTSYKMTEKKIFDSTYTLKKEDFPSVENPGGTFLSFKGQHQTLILTNLDVSVGSPVHMIADRYLDVIFLGVTLRTTTGLLSAPVGTWCTLIKMGDKQWRFKNNPGRPYVDTVKVQFTRGVPQCPICKRGTLRERVTTTETEITSMYTIPTYDSVGNDVTADENIISLCYLCRVCTTTYYIHGNTHKGWKYSIKYVDKWAYEQ